MKATFDNFFKIFLFVGGAFFGFWLKGCNGCNKPAPCPCDGKIISRIITHDTVKILIPDTASGWEKPVMIDPIEGGDIEKAIKTGQYSDETWGSPIHIWKISGKAVNEPEKASDYSIDTSIDNSSHLYESNYHFDNADVKVHTVSKCPPDSQKVYLSNVKKEIITTTSTIKELITEPKRNEMYLGISAMGNMQMPFYAFGPSLSFKTKTDRVLEAGVLYTRNNSIMYQMGIKLKISFRKQ
jgi:hypothetical protein